MEAFLFFTRMGKETPSISRKEWLDGRHASDAYSHLSRYSFWSIRYVHQLDIIHAISSSNPASICFSYCHFIQTTNFPGLFLPSLSIRQKMTLVCAGLLGLAVVLSCGSFCSAFGTAMLHFRPHTDPAPPPESFRMSLNFPHRRVHLSRPGPAFGQLVHSFKAYNNAREMDKQAFKGHVELPALTVSLSQRREIQVHVVLLDWLSYFSDKKN